MIRSFSISAVFLLSVRLAAEVLPLVSAEQLGLSQERLSRIRPAMERAIAQGEMAGGLGLIARHGKIGYFETWGMADRERSKPMPKDAIFRMYSMTKAVTGVAVMTLYEEGRFSLHDPISKFLPEFKQMKVMIEKTDAATGKRTYDTVPAEREMKILDLLRHTSGLNYTGPSDESGQPRYRQAGVG